MTPPQTSSMTQGIAPRTEKATKRQSGIRAMPAGTEMNVRTIGSMREKNTVASPHRAKCRSAVARSAAEMSTYLP